MTPIKPWWKTWAVLLLVLMPLAGCKQGPTFLSWQDEIKLGEEAAPEFLEQGGGELPSAGVLSYVRNMGHELARAAEAVTPDEARPELEWEFHVLDSQVINAFALPGGKVFVSRGLIEKMNNEAQLAGVIGHEIGHVTARHGNQRMSQAMLLQGAVIAVGVAGAASEEEWLQVLGVGTAVGGQLFLLKYSRSNEIEADELGVHYMSRVGYNPVGQVQVMEVLKAASGGAGPPEWLSTHPASDTRVEALESLIVEQYPLHDQPGHYVFKQAEFEQNILAPLSQLPPAKHPPAEDAPPTDSAFIGPDEVFAVAGMTWEQALHAGCACHAPSE